MGFRPRARITEMGKHPKPGKLALRCCEQTTSSLIWLGSALLGLCAVSILSMPVTQYLWSWDRFLRGGQDFEFGTLMALTLLCLALVLSRQCKHDVNDTLIQSCRMIFKRGRDLLPCFPLPLIRAFGTPEYPLLIPPPGVYRTPLQI